METWQKATIYLALDTSMLWDEFCHIRISVIYRERAAPLVWKTIKHNSSMVGLEAYQDLLLQAAKLLPAGERLFWVCFK